MYDQIFPIRIESAFRALAYTHAVETGAVTLNPRDQQDTQPRALTTAELALRNSAAEVIRNYITGEIRVPRARRPRAGRQATARGSIERLPSLELDFGDDADQDRPAA